MTRNARRFDAVGHRTTQILATVVLFAVPILDDFYRRYHHDN